MRGAAHMLIHVFVDASVKPHSLCMHVYVYIPQCANTMVTMGFLRSEYRRVRLSYSRGVPAALTFSTAQRLGADSGFRNIADYMLLIWPPRMLSTRPCVFRGYSGWNRALGLGAGLFSWLEASKSFFRGGVQWHNIIFNSGFSSCGFGASG